MDLLPYRQECMLDLQSEAAGGQITLHNLSLWSLRIILLGENPVFPTKNDTTLP
jgi:hypothetical protein